MTNLIFFEIKHMYHRTLILRETETELLSRFSNLNLESDKKDETFREVAFTNNN